MLSCLHSSLTYGDRLNISHALEVSQIHLHLLSDLYNQVRVMEGEARRAMIDVLG